MHVISISRSKTNRQPLERQKKQASKQQRSAMYIIIKKKKTPVKNEVKMKEKMGGGKGKCKKIVGATLCPPP